MTWILNNELSDSIFDRLTGSDEKAVSLAALLATYDGEPAVFTQDNAPDDAERLWIVVGPIVGADDFDSKDRDGFDASVDIGIYADNVGSVVDVTTAAGLVQRLMHRHVLAVSGYSVLVARARAPVVAPTDDTVVGRLVTVRWLLRSWESRG